MENSRSKNLTKSEKRQQWESRKMSHKRELTVYQQEPPARIAFQVMAEYLCDFNNLEEATTESTQVSHHRNFFPNVVRHFNFRSCHKGLH